MTSPHNHGDTSDIFEANDYFGLASDNVFQFQQKTLSRFGLDKRILLEEKGETGTSPDGHGGSLKALCESGAARDMNQRDLRHICYWQADNPLMNILDLCSQDCTISTRLRCPQEPS